MPTIAENFDVRDTGQVLYATTEDRAIVDAHLEAMGTCIWPKCTNFKAVDMHLCVTHIRQVEWFADTNYPRTNTPGFIKRERQFKSAQTLEDFKAGKTLEGLNQHIYIVKVGDLIKIGFSRDVKRRLRQYSPGTEVLAVAPGAPSIERYLHRKFAHFLVSGREWFTDAEPIRDLVQELNDKYGYPDDEMITGPAERVSPQEKQLARDARKPHLAFERFNQLPSAKERRDYLDSLKPNEDA